MIISLAAVSCGSQPKSVASAQHVTQPTQYTFRVKAEYPHLRTSYTQGLQFIDGELWEGTGEWGESVLQKIDLKSGKAEVLAKAEAVQKELKALEGDKIQCSKFGPVKTYDSCKKFVYSPLKRIPKKELQLANSAVNDIDF